MPTPSGTTCRSRRSSSRPARWATSSSSTRSSSPRSTRRTPRSCTRSRSSPSTATSSRRSSTSGLLAIGLLASWCIGRPYGVAPQALIGGSIALGAQMLVEFQAGEALNDIIGRRLHPGGGGDAGERLRGRPGRAIALDRRAALVVAGLAAGLAAGMKLSFLAPVAALTVGVVVLARAGRGSARGRLDPAAADRRALLVRPERDRDRQPDPLRQLGRPDRAARPERATSSFGPGSRSRTT